MNLSANENLSPKTQAIQTALKSWEKNGFYFLSPYVNHVLHRANGVLTHIYKIIFLKTGPLIIQGTPKEVSQAIKLVPDSTIPYLTLCLSEDLVEEIRNYVQSSASGNLDFSALIQSIFHLRLKKPDLNLFWNHKKKIHLPSQLNCLLGFIDEFVSKLINSNKRTSTSVIGKKSYYASSIGKGVSTSIDLSLKNTKIDFLSIEDKEIRYKKLVSAFLEDYLRDLKRRGFGSMYKKSVYMHFLIWASKLPCWKASFLITFPYQKTFFSVLEESHRVTSSLEGESKVFVFDTTSIEENVYIQPNRCHALDHHFECEANLRAAKNSKTPVDDSSNPIAASLGRSP